MWVWGKHWISAFKRVAHQKHNPGISRRLIQWPESDAVITHRLV